MNDRIPWTWAFIIPSVVNLVWGVVCFFFLPDRPESVPGLNGLNFPHSTGQKYVSILKFDNKKQNEAINFKFHGCSRL